jgi:hypothetical protein
VSVTVHLLFICWHLRTGIYQCPEGAGFRALFPTSFHVEDGLSCKLPSAYLPRAHVNYENRQVDALDDLPKYRTWPSGDRLKNNGELF